MRGAHEGYAIYRVMELFELGVLFGQNKSLETAVSVRSCIRPERVVVIRLYLFYDDSTQTVANEDDRSGFVL